jgi:hypothetical protein
LSENKRTERTEVLEAFLGPNIFMHSVIPVLRHSSQGSSIDVNVHCARQDFDFKLVGNGVP